MIRTSLLVTFALVFALAGTAQVQVDKPVLLEGATSGQRQVNGLANAANDDHAVNARTLQAGAYAYGTTSGGDAWAVTLAPAPASLTAGARLMVRAADPNSGPVTLAVNGLAALPVVKNGGEPLGPGDVHAGEVCALLFDGTVFHLVNERELPRRPCPSGYAQVNELYCISIATNDTLTYAEAALVCGGQDAQVCTWGQWYVACTLTAQLGLQDMVGDWEWTNDAANADGSIRMVGNSSCTHAGIADAYASVLRSHCCYRR